MKSTASEPRGIERETVAQGIGDFKSGGLNCCIGREHKRYGSGTEKEDVRHGDICI